MFFFVFSITFFFLISDSLKGDLYLNGYSQTEYLRNIFVGGKGGGAGLLILSWGGMRFFLSNNKLRALKLKISWEE